LGILFLLHVKEQKNLRHPQYMPKGYSVPWLNFIENIEVVL
jgi:hypothetical protein